MSSYYSTQLCSIHKEPFTNMCIDTKCLTPLCPECIEVHLREHKGSKIDSLKQCRTNCSKKIRSTISDMNKILQQQEMQTLQNQQQYIETCKNALQQIKQQIIEIMEIYIKQLLQDFASQLINTYKDSQIKEVYIRIKNLIQQLDELVVKLDSQTEYQIDTIKSIFLLNTNQLLQSSQNESQKEILKLQFPILIVSRNLSSKMDELLQQSIQIQIKQQMQTIVQTDSNQEIQNIDCIIKQTPSVLNTESTIIKEKKYSEFQIQIDDYFLPNTPNKYLHYFKFNSNELNLINLQNPKERKKITLQNNFVIPVFHQSIITKNGQIYLLGGSLIDNNYPNHKSNSIFILDKDKLQNVGTMIKGRSSQGCVIIDNYIYSISGLGQNQIQEKSCERFNYALRKSEQIQDCLFPSVASCCINFNDQYIYKFGGLYDQKQVGFIERFNLKDMIWQAIDPDILQKDAPIIKGFNQFSAGLQISPNYIMIFGGYDSNQQSTAQTLLCFIKNDQHVLQSVNVKPLKNPGGFWHQQCIIYNQEIYAVQNQENKEGEIIESKQILKFKDRWQTV